jgi:hypothetical protein
MLFGIKPKVAKVTFLPYFAQIPSDLDSMNVALKRNKGRIKNNRG